MNKQQNASYNSLFTALEQQMKNRFFSLAFSLLGRAASCTHHTLKQFHFLDLLPLVSSEYNTIGHTLTGRPCAASL